MEESIYIYQHLAMGDNILSNAIVRIYAEKYKTVYLFVLPRYTNNISYMFRDLKNLKLIEVPGSNEEIRFFMKLNPHNKYLVIYIPISTYTGNGPERIYKYFDEGFYKVANVPYEYKWDKFYFQRDIEKEKNIFYNILNLKDDEEFLFVHDDITRNMYIRPQYINKNIKCIHPTQYKNISIMDFTYTIEKAKEVHVINSAFLALIDTMQIKNDSLFIHEYAIKDSTYHGLKLNWNIIK